MKQAIASYHKDGEGNWVAELRCGHFQHLRHNPPWTSRPWVQNRLGRSQMLGHLLDCTKCDLGAAKDRIPQV